MVKQSITDNPNVELRKIDHILDPRDINIALVSSTFKTHVKEVEIDGKKKKFIINELIMRATSKNWQIKIQEWLIVNQADYTLDSEYKNRNIPVFFRHICGERIESTYCSFKKGYNSCKKCNLIKRIPSPNLVPNYLNTLILNRVDGNEYE